ncbi:MAG: glutathione S-transferase family protein [Rhodospirillales bacterium]|nr:glutathione S-transferase family protein [Rhodospirillales bacterium]
MIELFDSPSSGNAYKCRLLMHKLGLPYTRTVVDIDTGQTRTPDFLARNPNGRVPLLRLPDGTYIAESNAILCWLAKGTPWLPDDRLEFAQAMQWMFFEQYSHEPNIATVRYWLTHGIEITPLRAQLIDMKRPQGVAALGVMEGHLAGRDFFVGSRPTVADIALYAYTHVAEEGGFALAPFPNVRAWLARMAADARHIPITD